MVTAELIQSEPQVVVTMPRETAVTLLTVLGYIGGSQTGNRSHTQDLLTVLQGLGIEPDMARRDSGCIYLK